METAVYLRTRRGEREASRLMLSLRSSMRWLDWRRWMVYTHRWLGIAGGVLFVAWFVSGVVMMYARMPGLASEERLARAPALDLSAAAFSPIEAARATGIVPDRDALAELTRPGTETTAQKLAAEYLGRARAREHARRPTACTGLVPGGAKRSSSPIRQRSSIPSREPRRRQSPAVMHPITPVPFGMTAM